MDKLTVWDVSSLIDKERAKYEDIRSQLYNLKAAVAMTDKANWWDLPLAKSFGVERGILI